MRKLEIKIDVLEPIVFTGKNGDTVMTATKDAFSGTVLRGTLASRYIENNQLGKMAHQSEQFRKLFLQDEVCFTAAYPAVGNSKSMILPLSVQKAKVKPSEAADEKQKKLPEIMDLAFAESFAAGYKGLKGYAQVEAGVIYQTGVEKNISLHMDRSSDTERISGKSEAGNIYNYESIIAGQAFSGEIIGSKENLELLLKGLAVDENDIFYFGRSKYTQYGKCRISFGKITEIAAPDCADNTICLRCETAFIPDNSKAGDTRAAIGECAAFLNEAVGSESFNIVEDSIFASAEAIENFVGVWGLRRPDEMAVSAGSVFKITKSGEWTTADKDALQRLMYGGAGRRAGEGFGQFRLWNKTELKLGERKAAVSEKPVINTEVKKLAGRIVMNSILADMRQLAFADADRAKNRLKAKKHLFSRLEDMLGDRKKLAGRRLAFQQAVNAGIRDKSPAEKHLQAIKFGSHTLLDSLKGLAPMPYEDKLDWSARLGQGINKLAHDIDMKLPDKANDEIFYEYCLWFFRHARKKAANADKGAVINE